ncbi:MAG: ATP-binding cassette domain-containing protein, partial [Rikenellaceae bacterium]|nr:ATP-binding cassette domain-containing protein [Rikenellaceae bacterium]
MRESNINIDLRHIWVTTPSSDGKRRVLLKNVDLTVSEGEVVYLIGKVGSGKSSLMKVLYGEAPLTHGEGYVAGFSLNRLSRRTIPMLRRKLGMVFQDFQLLNDRTVYQNMRFVLLATGWRDEHHIKERIDETLRMVGLLHKSGSMPHQLSGGEQQRIAVGRAFINRPAVILADEPTGNLDPETAADIMDLFIEIASRGCSVIFATHNISVIEQYPARIIRISNNTLEEVEHSAVFGTHSSTSSRQVMHGTFRRRHDSPLFSVSGLSAETTFAIGGMATSPASFAPNGSYPEPATFSMPELQPCHDTPTEVVPVSVSGHRHPAPAAFGTPEN